MVPFQLIAPLKTPIIMGEHGVSFVTLLHYILFIHYGEEDKASIELDKILTKTNNTYHGSNAVFGITMTSPMVACWTNTIRGMRPNSDLHPDLFKPNGAKDKYKKVQTEGGLGGNRINNHKSYMAPYITFFAHGNQTRITELFNYYIHSLGYAANLGFGSIGEAWSQVLNEDHSFYTTDPLTKEQNLMVGRIPTDHPIAKEGDYKVRKLSLIPPFHREQPQIMCYSPERINRVVIA
jgi:hypothetical protein